MDPLAAPRESARPPRSRASFLAWLAAVLLALVTPLGFLGGVWWVLDLFGQFHVYYAVFAALLIPIALWQDARSGAALACLVLIINLVLIAPFYLASHPVANKGAPVLHLLQFNVRLENTAQRAQIARYIDDSDADLVLLIETDTPWVDFMKKSLRHYELLRSSSDDTLNHYFGISLYVRRNVAPRVVVSKTHELFLEHRHGHPALSAELTFAGKPIELLGVHQHPPFSDVHAAIRSEQFEGTQAWVEYQRDARIVFGDLNASPWSVPYRNLVANTHLVNAQRGFGLKSTWFPLGDEILGLPLDHCLYSTSLAAVAFHRGPAFGSDHRPLRVDLAWATDQEP